MKNKKKKIKHVTIGETFKMCLNYEHCRDCPLYIYVHNNFKKICILDTRTHFDEIYLEDVIEVIK
jgi:hypothetical protein